MNMKKKTLFAIAGGGLSLALAAVAIGGIAGAKAFVVKADSTATSTVAALATANKWVNATAYTSWALDTYVTVSTTGTGNNGKYYSSGSGTWRLYQAGTGNLIVTVKSGYSLVSVKATYAVANTGTLTGLTSATVTAATGSSVTYPVANTASATNGNVQISDITVVYAASTTPSISPDALANHINVGDTGTFTATTANVDSPVITWSSATTSVLTVNETTGAYSAVAYGTSLVTASMTVSGTTYSGSITVVVDGTATPTQILALGLASGETTSYKLTTSGTITAVATNSVTISDGTSSLMIYGTYSPNNAASKGWGVGGVVSFKGNVQYYNGTTYEIVSPSLVSYTGNATALANFIMMASTANQCATQFAIAKAQFLAMSSAEQALFQTAQTGEATVITNARARYEAWAVNQGDAAPYSSGAAVVDGLTTSTGMIAIAVVAVLGLLTLAGVVVLKKKHN
jgi:hypothetical protein